MPIALVSSHDEQAWLHERSGNGRRVTKTDAVRLANNPGIGTFNKVWAEKTGERKFHGNDATRRGHKFESSIQHYVEREYGIPPCNVLYAHEETPEHAATPDCALEDDGEWAVVEIKTTTEDWSAGLPQKIIDDVLWQAYVMGAGWCAVAWQQFEGPKGAEVPVGILPTVVEVPIDRARQQKLIDGANAYLAWVDAGRPDTNDDGVPLEVVEDIALVNAGKAAEARLRERMERGGEAVNITTPAGSLRFDVSESTAFDKAAFLAAEPELAKIVARADKVLKEAQKDPDYRKPTVRTAFRIAPPEEQEEAA